ncbi:hypothetical protein Q9306_18680 [Bacillus sp. WLY-B-L8]|nr:hypothetical protein [Bacillus sp. WLY-B-L8]
MKLVFNVSSRHIIFERYRASISNKIGVNIRCNDNLIVIFVQRIFSKKQNLMLVLLTVKDI